MKTLQKFTAVHEDRHLILRDSCKAQRSAALAEWKSLMA
jgi:hypothetical protein